MAITCDLQHTVRYVMLSGLLMSIVQRARGVSKVKTKKRKVKTKTRKGQRVSKVKTKRGKVKTKTKEGQRVWTPTADSSLCSFTSSTTFKSSSTHILSP